MGEVININKATVTDVEMMKLLYSKHQLPYKIELGMPDLNMREEEFTKRRIDIYNFRDWCVSNEGIGFALITGEFCDNLAKFIGTRKVLEVMSGKGVLAKGLHDRGVHIKCTDNYSWWGQNLNQWIEVEQLDGVEAVKKYGKDYDILLMSWAPYKKPDAYNILMEMRKQNPNMIMIYIGESKNGNCADNDFFNAAEPYFSDEELNSLQEEAAKYIEASSSFCRHAAMYDGVYIYK